jgi:hypothetical protein
VNEGAFWTLVAECRRDSDGDVHGMASLLCDRLTQLTPQDINDFCGHWHHATSQAYTWKLWAAALVMVGTVGDDGFVDFRSWLISHGRDAYDRIVDDPERLDELAWDRSNALTEAFVYIGGMAYERLTGEDPPVLSIDHRRVPAGDPIDLDNDDAVLAAVPRLATRLRAG